jgi:hypothetical protein
MHVSTQMCACLVKVFRKQAGKPMKEVHYILRAYVCTYINIIIIHVYIYDK